MRLNTKEKREAVREYERKRLTEKGYTREEYKSIEIFYNADDKGLCMLKAFRGSAAKPYNYTRYHNTEALSAAVERLKEAETRRQKFKEEQKEQNKGHQSSHAAAAAAIRKELKEVFAGIKFSVRSDSFSMGDAVRISWTDGPKTSQVDEIVKKYQYGGFNGMEDIYENTNSRNDIPQTKYVTTSREISDELEQAAREALKDWNQNQPQYEKDRDIYKLCQSVSVPAEAENLKFVRTEETCGHVEDFYRLQCDAPEVNKTKSKPAKQEIPAGKVRVIDYSSKAIAVIGETKPIKDTLKSLGGRFNFRLTCGAGWIFPKAKQAQIIEALQQVKSNTNSLTA